MPVTGSASSRPATRESGASPSCWSLWPERSRLAELLGAHGHKHVLLNGGVLGERVDVAQAALQRRLVVDRVGTGRLVAGIDDAGRGLDDPCDSRQHSREEGGIEIAGPGARPVILSAGLEERPRGSSIDFRVAEPILEERLIGELRLGVEPHFVSAGEREKIDDRTLGDTERYRADVHRKL